MCLCVRRERERERKERGKRERESKEGDNGRNLPGDLDSLLDPGVLFFFFRLEESASTGVPLMLAALCGVVSILYLR